MPHEDYFTDTVDGAAAFERHRGESFADDNRPTLEELADYEEHTGHVVNAASTSEADWDPKLFGMTYQQYMEWRTT